MIWLLLPLLAVVGVALWHVDRVNQQTAAENRRLTNENARLAAENRRLTDENARLQRLEFASGWRDGACPVCANPEPEVLVDSGCEKCVGCKACLTGWCVIHGADVAEVVEGGGQ